MAIDIFWATTQRIFIPRADMPIVQASPEIRELDVDVFRLELKDLEASVEGMPWPDTHRHVTETTLSGFTYARLFEILAPYTVEFEDGQYSVRTVGANHNILDVKINNQVSLAVQNSAGLINSAELQFSSFNGASGPGVLVDVNNTTGLALAGSAFPTGTARRPVNNFADALLIAAERGFNTIYVLGQGVTIDSGLDFQGFRFIGQSPALTSVTVDAAAQVLGCEFYDMTLDGAFDGLVHCVGCVVDDVDMVEGDIVNCGLRGTITLAGGSALTLINCYDGLPGSGIPALDFGGVGQAVLLRNYQGGITMRNKSGAHEVSVDINPGRLVLESTITNGAFIVKGIGPPVDDQSTGTATLNETALVSPASIDTQLSGTHGSGSWLSGSGGLTVDDIVDGILDEPAASHVGAGTVGQNVNRLDAAVSSRAAPGAEMALTSTAVAGLVLEIWGRVLSGTITVEQALDELHKLRGLDPANPLLIDKDNDRLRVPSDGSVIDIQGTPSGNNATYQRQ